MLLGIINPAVPDFCAVGLRHVCQSGAQTVFQLRFSILGAAAAQQHFTGVCKVGGVLLHQLMMGVDAVQVGIEGVGDLLLPQIGHRALGKLQV